MARADPLTIAGGTPGSVLMERAGRAVAAACAPSAAGGTSVAVLCGPGNNGGDGFVAARLLREAGHDVRSGVFGSRDALRGDAAGAAAAWTGAACRSPIDLSGADLVVDALFGAGLARDLGGAAARGRARQRARPARPVGRRTLRARRRHRPGTRHLVRATATVTFFRLKPGHLLLPGGHAGASSSPHIGIADGAGRDRAAPFRNGRQPGSGGSLAGPDGHKYERGHAVVLSGGAPTPARRGSRRGGAARSARGSSRWRARPTRSRPTRRISRRHAAAATGPGLAELLGDGRKNAVVLGPGLGVGKATRASSKRRSRPPTSAARPRLRARRRRADELCRRCPALADRLAARPAGPVVVTPHGGEFARLFAGDDGVLDAPSKLASARAAARRLGAVLVHKGRHGRRGAGRARLDQRGARPLARHGRLRRRSRRHDRRAACPGDAALRGRERCRVPSRRGGPPVRPGPRRRGSARDLAGGFA